MKIFPFQSLSSWVSALTLAFLAASASPAQAQAQQKIATIDLKKVFDGYYRTQQANTQLKERAADSQKVLEGMLEDYRSANEEYRKLIESANDQALSAEERQRRKKNAEAKLLEIQEIEKSITQYRQTAATTLNDQERRMRDNILREIQAVVTKRANTAGFSLVVDTAAQSINQTPVILYSNGDNDLTDEILKQINATAPPGLVKPEPK